MIQFNLLPDVKLQYIKVSRMKRTAIVISMATAIVTTFIFVMLFLTVKVFQKNHMANIDVDIAESTQTLKDTKDLNKVLTVQNQLASLPALHDQKPVTSRLFGYLTQLTPNQVNIGTLDLDYVAKTMSLSGSTDSLATVNKYVDTLKFTTYGAQSEAASSSEVKKPFSSVVLAGFTRTDVGATYQITLTFDPAIFDSAKDIALTVPKITSTRSETEKPTELFKALPETKKQ